MVTASFREVSLIAQCELAEDMEEKDAHLQSELGKRRRALLGVSWTIEPPRNATPAEKRDSEMIRELLEDFKAPEDGDYEWVDKATGEIHKIPRGIDPGFDYRPQTPAALTKAVAKREAAKPALAQRLPERMVESAYSSAKGVSAQGLSDLLTQLPAPQRDGLSAFLKAHPVKTLFIKQTEMGKGAASVKVAPAIGEYLGIDPTRVRSWYTTTGAARTNGFTYVQADHVVIKVAAGDKLNGVDMQAVQAAVSQVIVDGKANRGPRAWQPRGTSGDTIRLHWSVSANVGETVGPAAQRVSTWLHELGHQVHFWAGEPDLSGRLLLTEYGSKSKREAAAEAFAAWMLAPEQLAEHYPALAKQVEEMLAKAALATTKSR